MTYAEVHKVGQYQARCQACGWGGNRTIDLAQARVEAEVHDEEEHLLCDPGSADA